MRAVQPTPAPSRRRWRRCCSGGHGTRNGRFFRKVDSVALLACCGTREPEIAAKVEGRESRKVAPSLPLSSLTPSLSLSPYASIHKQRTGERPSSKAGARADTESTEGPKEA